MEKRRGLMGAWAELIGWKVILIFPLLAHTRLDCRRWYRHSILLILSERLAACDPALNFGSDSHLMKFWRGLADAMMSALHPSALFPTGFRVVSAACDGVETVLTLHPISKASRCPDCGGTSERVHSRYSRRLANLPLSGRPIRQTGLPLSGDPSWMLVQRGLFRQRCRARRR